VRVTIRTREQDGLLPSKKLYFTDCTVLFSEEEKAIVQARGLGQHYFVVGSEGQTRRAAAGRRRGVGLVERRETGGGGIA
jgi:hypothetical protein